MPTGLVAVTGASGVIYGIRVAEELSNRGWSVYAVVTSWARKVADAELPGGSRELEARLKQACVEVYDEYDYTSPFMSSSNVADAVVVAPCSVRTASSIAYGYAHNLVVRASLAALRLRRTLVVVVRETPLGIPELEALLRLALMGAIVLPASPAFYHKPRSVDDMVNFVVGKVLDALGIEHELYSRWGSLSG